tara:strand:+ start:6923 stop:7366 length:444 start_codon:yes stop_codon:yes gene_type:complete
MSKKILEKNVSPAIVAYVNATVEQSMKELQDLVLKLKENEGVVAGVQKDMVQLSQSVDAVKNSIDTIAIRTKEIIDAKLGSDSNVNEIFKEEVKKEIDSMSEQVSNFQISVDEMTSKLHRYFEKEKYSITKGIITEIINEEKLNGSN